MNDLVLIGTPWHHNDEMMQQAIDSYVGEVSEPIQPTALADDADDDELLEKTPAIVTDILGFDPATDEEFNADNLDWVKDPKNGQFTNTPGGAGGGKQAAFSVDPAKMKAIKLPKEIKAKGINSPEYAQWVKTNWTSGGKAEAKQPVASTAKVKPAYKMTVSELTAANGGNNPYKGQPYYKQKSLLAKDIKAGKKPAVSPTKAKAAGEKATELKGPEGYRDYLKQQGYNDKLREIAGKMSKSVSAKNIIEGMSAYSGTYYHGINEYLHRRDPIGMTKEAEYRRWADGTSKWIDANPLTSSVKLYRGMAIRDPDAHIEMTVGRVIHNSAFSSFSSNKRVATSFTATGIPNSQRILYELDAPKGAKFAPTFGLVEKEGKKSVAWNTKESEFLGQADLRFKVVNVSQDSKGVQHVKLEIAE